jgi:hypothetical protein
MIPCTAGQGWYRQRPPALIEQPVGYLGITIRLSLGTPIRGGRGKNEFALTFCSSFDIKASHIALLSLESRSFQISHPQISITKSSLHHVRIRTTQGEHLLSFLSTTTACPDAYADIRRLRAPAGPQNPRLARPESSRMANGIGVRRLLGLPHHLFRG